MTEYTHEERYQTIARVNWVCTVIDAVLSFFKLAVGFFARSPALIADGLHSLSDLATDILALILGKLAKHGPDTDHPYGHARYETVGTAILGTVLLMVALGIGIENVQAIFEGSPLVPHWLTLVAAVVSIISKEALFHYTMHFAKKTRSNLLEANAWHSRSDSLSSIVVLVGIGFNFAGFPFVEYLAALAVAALIGKMGAKLAWDSVQDLIDRGVEPEQQQRYEATLSSIEDIHDVHKMRTRLMGTDVMLDAHIRVSPRISVSEAHQISDYAEAIIESNHPEVKDITLHVDFEHDHKIKKTQLDPKRERLCGELETYQIPEPDRLYIHYLSNQVDIELVYLSERDFEAIKERCKELTQSNNWINSIRVFKPAC